MKKEPAALIGLAAAVLVAVTEIIQAATQSGAAGFDLWTAVRVGLPLLAGLAIRNGVIPVETVREVITGARTATGAVTELSTQVGVAIGDQPRA